MSTSTDLDAIRSGVLARMERHTRNTRLAIAGAVLVELLFLGIAAGRMEFSNRVELLMFSFFVLTYTIVLLGLAALGAHVSRVGDRVLAAMLTNRES